MRAVLLDVPESLLAERRRTGADRFDEIWDGVLHMVPPPVLDHQRIGGCVFATLVPLAAAAGLEVFYEAGLFRPGTDTDYRIPDVVVARPEHLSDRGVEGRAELVVEVRSPGDETYDKLPFYAGVGVREVVVVHPPSRTAEAFRLAEGHLRPVEPDPSGALALGALGLRLRTVDGPALELAWGGGTALC